MAVTKKPRRNGYPIIRGPKNVKKPTEAELVKLERDQKIRRITRRNPGTAA